MADWSDLVGLKLIDAQAKAARYDHDLVVTRVGSDNVKTMRPCRTPTVQVAISQPGVQAIVTAVMGDEDGTPAVRAQSFQ